MSLLRSVIGGAFGFVVGGPLGAILGASIAHQLGNREETKSIESSQAQMAFFVATFSVMGHVAKVNGRVYPEAISFAKRTMSEMQLDTELQNTAINLFQQGKQINFPLDHILAQFYQECHQHPNLIQRFLDIQLQTAIVNGTLTSHEDAVLWHLCHQLKISQFNYQRIKIRRLSQQYFYQQTAQISKTHTSNKADAYKVLGLTPAANQADVKQAYRRLMSQHHPDKLASKGLSEATMLRAKEKTQQISKAYKTIQKLTSA